MGQFTASCESNDICDSGLLCIGGICACLHGYKYNFTSQECEPKG